MLSILKVYTTVSHYISLVNQYRPMERIQFALTRLRKLLQKNSDLMKMVIKTLEL